MDQPGGPIPKVQPVRVSLCVASVDACDLGFGALFVGPECQVLVTTERQHRQRVHRGTDEAVTGEVHVVDNLLLQVPHDV